MYCDHCGAQIPDEATFCRKCGTRLEAVPVGQERAEYYARVNAVLDDRLLAELAGFESEDEDESEPSSSPAPDGHVRTVTVASVSAAPAPNVQGENAAGGPLRFVWRALVFVVQLIIALIGLYLLAWYVWYLLHMPAFYE